MHDITSTNRFRLKTRELGKYITSPQRNKPVTITSEASLQSNIDGCLRRATLGKFSLGEAAPLGKTTALGKATALGAASALNQVDSIVAR